MENSNKKTTTTIVIVIILLIVAFGIFVFMKSRSEPVSEGLTVENANGTTQSDRTTIVGQKLLSLLRPLQTLDIDNNFFNDERFKSLVDFSIDIPNQPTREVVDNPFAPIPGTRRINTATAGNSF